MCNHFSKFIIFYSLLGLFACTSNELKPDGITPGIPLQRVFFGDYNDVNNAIRAAMKKYPVREDNLDLGIFETDYIKGDKMFHSPGSRDRIDSGIRYRIQIHTIKGKVENKSAIRMIIKKALEKNRDFFADAEPLPTDGMEENILFYRVARELSIAKAMKRSAETPKP